MFKKKSFDLVKQQEQTKKQENMYAAPQCRCMRCLAIPALIAFILLLILSNVDYNGVSYDIQGNTTEQMLSSTTRHAERPTSLKPTSKTSPTPPPSSHSTTRPTTKTTEHATKTTTRTTGTIPMSNMETEINSRALQNPVNDQPVVRVRDQEQGKEKDQLQTHTTSITEHTEQLPISFRASGCKDYGTNCNITCTGDVFYLYQDLDDYYCTKLNLILEDCHFQNGKLDRNFFIGSYKVQNLIIKNCNLQTIESGAFEKSAVEKLGTLSLINTQLPELNRDTFKGLQNLHFFKLINAASVLSFNGSGFLLPMSGTLNETVLQVQSKSTAYDPKVWLEGAYFNLLKHVDFSGNLFPHTLNVKSFEHLKKVQALILETCKINAIGAGTFDGLMTTLRYLDLSNNQLQTLNGNFLRNLPATGFRLELGGNAWNCSCDNSDLLRAVQMPDVIFTGMPTCTSPDEWLCQSMLTVSLDCRSYESTTVSVNTTANTTAVPTITTTTTTVEEASDTSENSSSGETSSSSESQESETTVVTDNIEIESTTGELVGYPTTETVIVTPTDDYTETSDICEQDSTTAELVGYPTTYPVTEETNTTIYTTSPITTNQTIPADNTTTPHTTYPFTTGETQETEEITTDAATTDITSIESTTQIQTTNTQTTGIQTTNTQPTNTHTTDTQTVIPTSTTSTTSAPIPVEELVIIVCRRIDNSNFTPAIRNYTALFNVYTVTPKKVVLRVQGDMKHSNYIYFVANSSTAGYKRRSRSRWRSRPRNNISTTSNYVIDGLVSHYCYIFCLILDSRNKVSTFDCRAHYLDESVTVQEPWLRHTDMTLFISLSVLGGIMALCLGAALLYGLLRCRPTWLKGSRRLVRVELDGCKVYLLPKADYNVHSMECPYAYSGNVNMDPSAEGGTERACQCKLSVRRSSDYMRYYKSLGLSRLQRSEQIGEHKSPAERAPSVPSPSDSGCSSLRRPTSSQSTLHAEQLMSNTHAPRFDYEYQSLEVYEEVF